MTEPTAGGSAMGDDQAIHIREIFEDIHSELDRRIDLDDLSEKDHLAINTAIGKAAWRGFLRGVANHAHRVNEAWAETRMEIAELLPSGVVLPDVLVRTQFRSPEGEIVEPDAWAERYGEDSR